MFTRIIGDSGAPLNHRPLAFSGGTSITLGNSEVSVSDTCAPTSAPDPPGSIRMPGTLVRPINRMTVAGMFLSVLAHELNNPLQVISGLVELMEGRADLPPDVAAKLQKIAVQASRAGDTIRLVQGFIRDRSTDQTRVDVRDVVARALALRRYPLARANVAIRHEPPPAGVATVTAVEGLLVLAIVDVLINAEQALSGRSGSELRITIDVDPPVVRVRFADNGAGIDPAARPRVFEPFFSTKPPDQSLGLGLTAAREIVEAAGGRMCLEETTTGSSFVMELPLA